MLDLPNQSNAAKPGRWMFRIDSAKIEASGCNTKGTSQAFAGQDHTDKILLNEKKT